jgi:putative transport protein
VTQLLHGLLQAHPEIAFFLVLGLGYLIGKVSIGSFKLGAVTGTLLAGVVVGQLGVTLPNEVKQCFFLLFLFAIGFRTGPQFFRGLKKDGMQHAALSVVVAVAGLAVACVVAKAFGYDAGTAAGLIAGSLTESATIGTAMDAIGRLDVPEATRSELSNNIPVAFAVTYLVGVTAAAWFLSQIAPRIMRVNLAEECRKLEERTQGGEVAKASTRQMFEMRGYAIDPGSKWAGRKAGDLEASSRARVFVERIRRRGDILEGGMTAVLQVGDVIAVSGPRETLVEELEAPGSGLRETDDRELLNLPAEMVDVVVTNSAVDGMPLAALAREEAARGVFLRRLARAGTAIGVVPDTKVHRGDVLTIVGPTADIARAIEYLGVADRATDATDMFVVATGIVAGALVGLPALHLGGVEIGLSLPVGVLLGGLVAGWLRSVRPNMFGRIPGATLWVFESIGLTGFVAVVGLNAGPDFITGLRSSGPSLLLAGLITVMSALLIGVIVGRWVFKMHPGVLLGVCAGACTATPALAAVQEAAKSAVPSIGYGVAYAIGNVLLAIWGTVIVVLIS